MRKLTKNKKAYTIADIPWIAIVLGVGVIVLSITTEIVGEIRDTQKLDDTSTVANESVTLSSGAGSLVQGSYFASASACRNESMDPMDLGVLCNVSSLGNVICTELNCTNNLAFIDYTYYTPTYEYNITIKGQLGQAKIANWLPTIGLVLGAVIVIVALSILFTMRFKRN